MIGSTQAKPAETTNNDANMLMDYLYTHLDATLRFNASDIQLRVDLDAAYLVVPKAKSRVARYFSMSKKTKNRR